MHDLLGGVVGVDDVGPGDVPEIFALLQLLSWLAHLEQRQILARVVNRKSLKNQKTKLIC